MLLLGLLVTAFVRADDLGYSPDGGLVSFGDFDYVYDSASRLMEVWSNGEMVVENRYDVLGRRVIKRTPDATHTFVYDGWLLVVERVKRSNGVHEQIDYWWGKDISGTLDGAGGVGGLLYIRKNGCEVYVPLYDGMGNVAQYVDKHGTLVASYSYDAFGNTIQKSGVKADELKMRFSTKYFDDEAGLYYFGRRFYSPRIARWLTRDPIEERGGLNLYAFCGNNSVINFDKDGCAFFAKRRLSVMPWRIEAKDIPGNLLIINSFADLLADLLDIELQHEQLFMKDGRTYGWDSRMKYMRDEKYTREYVRTDRKTYDDCIMDEAIKRVKPTHYQLTWIGPRSKYNCQDYATALRREYSALEKDRKIWCKCKKGYMRR